MFHLKLNRPGFLGMESESESVQSITDWDEVDRGENNSINLQKSEKYFKNVLSENIILWFQAFVPG